MPVTYELRDQVATITLDDGKANAIGQDVLDDLNAILDKVDAEPEARALLIAGRPGRFSAGFDLAAMTSSPESMRRLVIGGGRLCGRLLMQPRPVVMACTGHALAAGALILLSGDHRIGAEGDWKIGLNEVSIGMPMPRWGVELASYRLAPTELTWRLVLGQTGSPDEATRAGFLDRVVPADQVLAEATATAAQLAGLRSGAVSGTKERARGELISRMLDDIEADLASVTVPQVG
ncbi:MAG TPA: crotonase/enoyl-CoA hydratase family protein [Acidimicrobiales bacterium]|jgi:enoyl-CoA hydratase|nr:crotonase/enoyl-CoA hydratase family protein [Acidimicrobiales bacterium]